MKNYILLTTIIALAVATLVLSERRHVEAEISPAPILYFVADTERELTRIPVSLTRISEQQEVEIGDEMARHYIESNQYENSTENREIAAYISEVGMRVAEHAHRKLPYKFHYIPQEYFVNAFALPGGHVFIGKGLLDLMDTEDELANILGHEIEHADLGHCVERAQVESAVQKVPLGTLVRMPIEMFEAGYSKDQELEADREGAKLGEAVGYTAAGAISMFRKFQKVEEELRQYRDQESRQRTVLTLPIELGNVVVVQTLEGYFRTHPPESERIAQMERLMAAADWPADQRQKTLAIAYLLTTEEARRRFAANQLDKALDSAKKALEMKPDYAPALFVVADVDFERADFTSAAEMYGRLLRLDPKQDQVAAFYATSLSASSPAKAALTLYASVADAVPDLREQSWFSEEQAGLKLMTGDAAAATALTLRLKGSDADAAPILLGRLGWWYYRSGDLTTAADIIGQAVEQRPQVAWMSAKLGWVLIAQRKYESAQNRFTSVESQNDAYTRAEIEMGTAVCAWNEGQGEIAISNFRRASRQRAAWLNPRWVGALYGPQVSAATQAIHAESERHKKPQQR
jgi:beta-barrel assembly-enhancing protease